LKPARALVATQFLLSERSPQEQCQNAAQIRKTSTIKGKTMTYIEAHRARLSERHYITNATSGTHWYNFYAGTLDDYHRMYGDEFCLVINCSENHDDAYVVPFNEVKEMFTREYLNDKRWVGNVIKEYLSVSLGGNPMREMDVGHFHNAFELLQDAPQPFPVKPKYV
jgi:hypothetical protein